MKQFGSRIVGCAFLLFGVQGCAAFWEEVMSSERDWAYITGHNKPNPLVVIRDSTDGYRRAQALAELTEPKKSGGSAKDQDVYLEILGKAAKIENEYLCRLTAISTLGKYSDPRAAVILEEVYRQQHMPFTKENNSFIRKQALVALEKTKAPDAVNLMVLVARGPGPTEKADLTDLQQTQDEKIVAVRALGNYSTKASTDALKDVLQKEKNIALRDLAVASLHQITGKEWPKAYEAWQSDDLRPEPGLAHENTNFIQRVSGIFSNKQ